MDSIQYREIIKAMEDADHDNGKKTFSLVFMKCNRDKRTGGQLVKVEHAKKCGLPYHCADHEMRGIVDQYGNKTAVHLRLIFEFNGLTVYP